MYQHLHLNRAWRDDTMNLLPSKCDGRTVMTADCVTVLDGLLRYVISDACNYFKQFCQLLRYDSQAWEEIKSEKEVLAVIRRDGEERARRVGSVLDVSTSGYYNNSLFLKDIKKVRAD